MRKQLFIRLTSEPAAAIPQATWVLREKNQRPRVSSGALNEAAAQAAGARVTVLVPGEDVLLAQVKLPALKGQRLARAAPYALEEQLADDVESLHVAVGDRDSDGQVANAVVSRATLGAWLKQLRDAGLHADVVSPEVFGVPRGEARGSWSLMVEDGRALLRSDTQMGLVFATENTLTVLSAALQGSADHRPETLKVTSCGAEDFAASHVWQELTTLCEAEGIGLEHHPAHTPGSAVLAQGFEEDVAINLLQGDFSTRGQLRKFFTPWRPVLILLVVWMVVQAGLTGYEYSRLKARQAALQTQIEAVFQRALPDSRLVAGQEKVLMQRALSELQGEGGAAQGMLELLSRAGPVLQGVGGLQLRGLRYRNQSLDVDMVLPNLQVVDTLKQQLMEKAGLTVDILSASARDNQVESRMNLRAARLQSAGPTVSHNGGGA